MAMTVDPLSTGQVICPEDLNSVMAARSPGERFGPAFCRQRLPQYSRRECAKATKSGGTSWTSGVQVEGAYSRCSSGGGGLRRFRRSSRIERPLVKRRRGSRQVTCGNGLRLETNFKPRDKRASWP